MRSQASPQPVRIPSAGERVERVVDQHHGEDAHRQLARRRQLLVGGELVGGADGGLADAGDAVGEEALPGRAQGVLQLGCGWRWGS